MWAKTVPAHKVLCLWRDRASSQGHCSHKQYWAGEVLCRVPRRTATWRETSIRDDGIKGKTIKDALTHQHSRVFCLLSVLDLIVAASTLALSLPLSACHYCKLLWIDWLRNPTELNVRFRKELIQTPFCHLKQQTVCSGPSNPCKGWISSASERRRG